MTRHNIDPKDPAEWTFERILDRAKCEINDDIEAGRLPSDPRSFSLLHDYVDANEYGGFCDSAAPDPEGFTDMLNRVQNALDAWLATGRGRAPRIALEFEESVGRAEESFWSALGACHPDVKAGDLPPDVAKAFTDACKAAARAWLVENFDPSTLGGKTHGEWSATWEYPGFVAWHRPGCDISVHATPNFHEQGKVAIQVENDADGTSLHRHEATRPEGPWDGTVAGYFAIVGPVLDMYTAKPSTMKVTVDFEFTGDPDLAMETLAERLSDMHDDLDGRLKMTHSIRVPDDNDPPSLWEKIADMPDGDVS